MSLTNTAYRIQSKSVILACLPTPEGWHIGNPGCKPWVKDETLNHVWRHFCFSSAKMMKNNYPATTSAPLSVRYQYPLTPNYSRVSLHMRQLLIIDYPSLITSPGVSPLTTNP